MGAVVLDTSVVIGSLNPDDVHHAEVMKSISGYRAAHADFRISAVTYAELLSARNHEQIDQVKEFVSLFGERMIVPVDAAIAERAGALRARRRTLRLPDALIAATAIEVEAEVLLTTDRALARLDGTKLIGAGRR